MSSNKQSSAKAPRASKSAKGPLPTPPTLDSDHSELAQSIASQLVSNTYECMVCTESIRHSVATWSCTSCYRVFHLYCMKKWAKQEDSGKGRKFRCPSCQTEQDNFPNKYRCFCSKSVDPPPSGFHTPHSCGEPCGKVRNEHCPHKCNLPCHPGPCPDCNQMAPAKNCPCGKTTYTYPCGKPDPKKTCDNVCGKMLSCGNHTCEKPCHHGPCPPCDKTEEVSCHCGRDDKMMPCGSKSYSCNEPCGRLLRCGEHHCTLPCHEGNCPPCDTDPEIIYTCPCGKEPLKNARVKCTDPIPACGQLCNKVLLCGNHYCELECHEGPCPQCESKVQTSCPCGSQKGKVYCKDQEDFRCHKKCKTKLSCGKHECEEICCPYKNRSDHPAHKCTRVCGKKLKCGCFCTELCHKGQCPQCLNVITTSISCRCGAEELIPPLPCGTQPPTCNLPCKIERSCGHVSVPHTCHFGECPPCMHPVEKKCAGGHTTMTAPCYLEHVSCGAPCGKKLPCGHLCARKCHTGECEGPIEDDHGKMRDRKCQQQCLKPLPCGHKCLAKCHPGKACPSCTTTVTISCDCGNLKQNLNCTTYLAKKEKLDVGMPVALNCNDDCAHSNRLSALASLSRGTTSAPKKVIYSIKAWQFAKQNMESVATIERKLIDFVRSGDHTLSLNHMPPEKRMIVHELCNVFHLNCESVDREPVRSCLVTRHGKSAVPTPLLSEAIYDDRNDPETYSLSVLNKDTSAVEKVIILAGPHLTDVAVSNYLRPHCGNFVIVPAYDGDKTDEGYVFNVVFTSKAEMSSAYSHLRKTDCPVTFRMYGHSTPPTPGGSSSSAAAPKPKTRYADPSPGATPTAGGGGGGGSWASLIKTDSKSSNKKKAEPVLSTKNKFASLGR